MKNCPKCRVETGSDAEWCWFCGYAFEEEDDSTGAPPSSVEDRTPAKI